MAGMTFSLAMDCNTLGVPYRVARHEEIDDMYSAESSRKPSADTCMHGTNAAMKFSSLHYDRVQSREKVLVRGCEKFLPAHA